MDKDADLPFLINFGDNLPDHLLLADKGSSDHRQRSHLQHKSGQHTQTMFAKANREALLCVSFLACFLVAVMVFQLLLALLAYLLSSLKVVHKSVVSFPSHQ